MAYDLSFDFQTNVAGPTGTGTSEAVFVSGEKRASLVRFEDLVAKIASGGYGAGSPPGQTAANSYNLVLRGAKTSATATVTLASVLNNDTVTINGVVFTAKTSGPVANQWLVGISNTADAAALAAAVNASTSANIQTMVLATSSGAVVTLSALPSGLCGNFYTLASSNGGRLAVSGANFANGAETSTLYAL